MNTLFLAITLLASPMADSAQVQQYIAHGGAAQQADSALYYFNQAASIAMAQQDTAGWLQSRRGLGRWYINQGQLLQAVPHLHNATQHPMAKQGESVGWLWATLAYCLNYGGDYPRAQQAYEEALVHLRRAGHQSYYVATVIYRDLGNIYTRLGDYERAETYLRQFHQAAVKEQQVADQADALADLALVYLDTEAPNKALHSAQQGLALPALPQRSRGLLVLNQAKALNALAKLPEALGSAHQALEHLQQAHAQREAYNISQIDVAHLIIGRIHQAQGHMPLAKKHYTLALEHLNREWGNTTPLRGRGKVLLGLAQLARSADSLEKASTLYHRVLSQHIPDLAPGQAPSENQLLAENSLLEALEGLAACSSNLHDRVTYYRLALATERHLAKAYRNESAMLLLQQQSRARHEAALANAMAWYMEGGGPEALQEAFAIMEFSKATVLSSALRQKKVLQPSQEHALVEAQLKEQKTLVWLEDQLRRPQDSATAAYLSHRLLESKENESQLRQALAEQFSAYAHLLAPQPPPLLASFQRTLKAQGINLALNYFMGQNHLYLLAASPQNAHLLQLPIEAKHHEWMEQWRLAVSDYNTIINQPETAAQYFQHAGHGLYQWLVAPAEKWIGQENTNLLVMPDGFLGLLPLGLLPASLNGQPFNYRTADYLQNHHTLAYGYSAQVFELQTKKQAHGAPKSFGGFAPSYEYPENAAMPQATQAQIANVVRQGQLPLPGALKEVEALAKLMDGEAYTGSMAQELTFKAQASQYDVIHLAMHTLLDPEDPRYSQLLFTGSAEEGNEGLLHIAELYTLNLQARMAVLSACNSGNGKVFQGEGIMSIARAFAYAGCPSTIMSLWQVPDESARPIMVSFYQHLKQGHDKPEALLLAQQQYLAQTEDPLRQHPYFWATFVPYGNPASLYRPAPRLLYIILLSAAFVAGSGALIVLRHRVSSKRG